MNLFNRNKPSRVRKACQVAGNAEEPEEEAVADVESGPGELMRKKQRPAEQRTWSKLFSPGFNSCSPRLRSARKFTK